MDVNGPFTQSSWYWIPRVGFGGKSFKTGRPAWYSIRWFNLYLSIYP